MSGGRVLEGKGALVTGAGTGIGKAIALAFAHAGAIVTLAGRRAEPLDAVKQEVTALGGTAHVRTADVSKQPEAFELVEAAKSAMGRIDVLVNNAGKTYDALVLRMKWDALEESLAIMRTMDKLRSQWGLKYPME